MSHSVIGSTISKTTYTAISDCVTTWAVNTESRFVCVANVHMLMEAYDSPAFREVVNKADATIPDGVPLVWMLWLKGERNLQRVYGPTFMLHILETAAREGTPVGFYGSTPQVLASLIERMQARYEGLIVAYSFSPPFHALSPVEDAVTVEEINRSGTRILFVGLGCPKQEIWMAEHRGKVNAVMIGVGAAFDFHAGKKLQSPSWMQKIGLEWLFRLITEPRRLWKRYLYHNPRFVVLAIADLLRFMKG